MRTGDLLMWSLAGPISLILIVRWSLLLLLCVNMTHCYVRLIDYNNHPYWCPVLHSFYPRDAMRRAGLCESDVSVRVVTAGVVSKLIELVSWFLHRLIAPWHHSLATYDRRKIRKGSPPARAIRESGVGSNGRFLRFFDL